MSRIRLEIAKSDIIEYFNNLNKKILKRSDIEKSMAKNHSFWRVGSTTVYEFIQFLLEETELIEIKLSFPHRNEIRYTWGDLPFLEVILTIRPKTYFSHYSAMYLHGLTEQIPKILYINYEQSPKRGQNAGLMQDRIDLAFSRLPRISKNIATYKNNKICLLNGKYTGELGVIAYEGPSDEQLRVTNVERTLIDITVRPSYSGGISEVLNAYRLAQGKVSINKMAAMLKKIDYKYPYHQAIGFYLEKSGVYKESLISLFKKFDFEFDFYIAHGIKNKSYSKKWRLYYPQGL